MLPSGPGRVWAAPALSVVSGRGWSRGRCSGPGVAMPGRRGRSRLLLRLVEEAEGVLLVVDGEKFAGAVPAVDGLRVAGVARSWVEVHRAVVTSAAGALVWLVAGGRAVGHRPSRSARSPCTRSAVSMHAIGSRPWARTQRRADTTRLPSSRSMSARWPDS